MNQVPVYYPVYPFPNPYMIPHNIQYPEMLGRINYLMKENESLQNSINHMNKNIDSLIELNKVVIEKVNVIDDKCIKIENKMNTEKKTDNMISMNQLFNTKEKKKKDEKKHAPLPPLPNKKIFNNILDDIIKDGEGSIIIQMETDGPNPFAKSMNSSNSLFNPFKMLSSIFGDKKNEKDVENELQELDVISECGSDVEVEELDTEIKTIDDLIKVGSTFDKIKGKSTQIKSEDKENIKKELQKFGIADDIIEKMLSENEILMDKKYKTTDNTYEEMKENTKPSVNKGLYEINGKKYPINLETLNKLVKPLTKLKNTIGMEKVKSGIFDMILYYLQNFETKNNNMLHTIIEGPPGVGKTMIGRIIGEIYAALGIIPSNKFKLVKRTDLIGEYVGHTAHKTQKAIDEANGGVLFIDEAYSLGSDEKKDTFSKECIDIINQNLSENKKKFICIVAGYPHELESCFFSYNPGLKRRFPFKYSIEGYTSDEMYNIFMKMVHDIKWNMNNNISYDELINICKENKNLIKRINGVSVEEDMKIFKQLFSIDVDNDKMIKYMNENKEKFNYENDSLKDITTKLVDIIHDSNFGFPFESYYKEIITKFFEKNKNEFKNFGGDLENLLVMCKFSHSKRIIGKHPKLKRKFSLEDIQNGFNKFVENKKKDNDEWKKMYI
jgi:SpoVK/Ycf46/Vps4 family AAA+-type ATPase